ncbi:MAG TPA: hypothetical protein VF174_16755 [Micromonosporaceae bacterium]
MIKPDEGSGSPLAKVIKVDLAGLADLATVIRTESEQTLVPQSRRVCAELQNGVCFGKSSASGYIHVARERYQQSLVRAMAQLSAYIRAAEVLADAAERVAKDYRATDALSAARLRDVEAALRTAMKAADGTSTDSGQESLR